MGWMDVVTWVGRGVVAGCRLGAPAATGLLLVWSVIPAVAQQVADVPAGESERCVGQATDECQRVHFCAPVDPNATVGPLTGRVLHQPWPEGAARSIPRGTQVETIHGRSDPANRLNFVTVGDGYLVTELDTYRIDVDAAIAELFEREPFSTYRNYFNVHRVLVTSSVSGVTNDPFGVERETPLSMSYFCQGIERLICIDEDAASAYAAVAPGVDQILAFANATRYGGAGYRDLDLITLAGGNAGASEIAIHELGHSVAGLADEYHYHNGAEYVGGEPSDPNVSTLTGADMLASGTKWAAWLGSDDPTANGAHATFEGGLYAQYGIFRPTFDSQMRSLGHPFNLPSIEAFIVEFYRFVDPIDATSHAAPGPLPREARVSVELLEPVGHTLDVTWWLDDALLVEDGTTTLDIETLSLGDGSHTLSVRVVDPTPRVRDEVARAMWMTGVRTWTILPWCPENLSIGDGADEMVDLDDLAIVLGCWADPSSSCAIADLTEDGIIDFSDLARVLGAWGPCPR